MSIQNLLAAHEYQYGRPAIKNTLADTIMGIIGEKQAAQAEQQKEQRVQQQAIELYRQKTQIDAEVAAKEEMAKQNRLEQENARTQAMFDQMSSMDDRTVAGDVRRVAEGNKGTLIQRKVSTPISRNVKMVTKDGKKSLEVTEEINPQDKPLSPILQNAKDKRLEDVVMTVQDYNVKRDALADAVDAMGRIEGGRYGALNRIKIRELDPNNPALEDWQKLKIVLLDETLSNTIKTKGAISDREMELFQKAAANDDVFSIKASLPVLRRALKKMNAEEKAKVVSYRNLYKEDPYELQGVESNISRYEDMFNPKDSVLTPKIDVTINSVGVGVPQKTQTGTTYTVLE